MTVPTRIRDTWRATPVRRRLHVGMVALLAAVLAVTLARGAAWLPGEDAEGFVVTADFSDTTGLYVGNDVTYLGVTVGEVVRIEPRGRVMRVRMELEPDIELPRDAGAQILQSSLVTDRYVELGPAYASGPTLASGAHIEADHTRSPATVDEIASAIDDLVVALDGGNGGKNLGDLLGTGADALRGNAGSLRRALSNSTEALEVLNSNQGELTSVTTSLNQLVDMLVERDQVIRRLTRTTSKSVGVLADQRDEMTTALDSLDRLTRLADRFLAENGDVLRDDLRGLARVVSLVRDHQGSLEESFDTMPTLAQNYARAYDWDLGRLRVQFSFRAGPFSATFRDFMCRQVEQALTDGTQVCRALFRPDGTGLLDPVLDGLFGTIPRGTP